MALIVEDGTIVPNANSYIDETYLDTYVSDRNITGMPTLLDDKEALIFLAMDYLESFNFVGRRTDSDQALSWPRTGVYYDCIYVESDEIPEQIKKALAQLAVEQNSSDIAPNGTGRETTKEKVDVIEVTYAENGDVSNLPILNKVKNQLRDFIRGSGASVPVIRA